MNHPPQLILSPLKPAVPAAGGSVDVVLRVQAPPRPTGDAAAAAPVPKRLVLVVDRSGSMHGTPLEEALKCVAHIAGCMGPKDQLGVVVYDHRAQLLLPLGPVHSQEAVARALADVDSGGQTNLFGGWELGAQQLEGGKRGSISRILLLSDGQANQGLVEPAAIARHCAEALARGISTTTVGLGRGFNEELMCAMAQAGGGQQYYGQTAADLFDGFDEELSLLQALCLRQLRLKLVPAPGVIAEPLGVVDCDPDGRLRLSDLAWEAEAWLAVRLHVAPSEPGSGRALLAATLEGLPLQGAPVVAHAPLLSLPVLDAAAHAAAPEDEAVLRRLQEADFAQRSLALAQRVREGDVQGARAMLPELEQRFANHPRAAGQAGAPARAGRARPRDAAQGGAFQLAQDGKAPGRARRAPLQRRRDQQLRHAGLPAPQV